MYDTLGNYIGGYDLGMEDAEAERRRREEERRKQQAQVTPVKQTVTIDPVTGEQKMKIEGSVQDLSAANPLTPTVTAPVSPTDLYNQYTARQESGANPNIGYHDPSKSTAYGTYGITQPQYQEIQKANPQFAGRDITSLTPQEQTQANTTSRDVYANQLRAKGVEPTEANLRLAHFLGAGGANQFLKSGAISPQAAAANGGEERVRQIAQQRLQGPAIPGQQPGVQMASSNVMSDVAPTPNEMAVSQLRQQGQMPPAAPINPLNLPQNLDPRFMPQAGAMEQAGPTTNLMNKDNWADRLNIAKNGTDGMLATLAYDANAPRYIQEEATLDLYKKLDDTRKQKQALQEWQTAVKNGDIVPVMNKVKKGTEEGSWLKYLLYQYISPEAAKNELQKLNPEVGATWQSFTSEDGQKQGIMLVGKNGQPIKGKYDDLTPLTENELVKYATGATGKNKVTTGMTLYNMSDDKTATLGNDGKFYRNGRPLPANVSAVSEFKEGVNQRKQTFNEAIKQLGKWYEIDPSQITPQALQNLISQLTPPGGNRADTLKMLKEDAVNKGANPQVVQKIDNVGQQITQTSTPGSTIAGSKSNLAVSESTGKKLGESNIEYANGLAKVRSTFPAQRSTIDRLQKSIDSNPEFWGVVSTSPAFMAFRDAQSDEKKSAALNQLAINLNIPAAKRAQFDSTMNDYRNLEVNSITSSGLSASQLNTEKESQRVVQQIGNIGDKPQAAKAALEYAKAKMEYVDAKARAFVQARKGNPNLDQLEFEDNFDATQGEQIFKDANERMAKIVGGKVSGAASAEKTINGVTYVYDGKGWKKK